MPNRSAQLWGLAGLTLLTRIPFVFAGFGLQPDAVRVALAARAIRETGAYVPSRLGANALHEVLAAALIDFGPPALNLLSALGAVGVAVGTFLLVERVAPRRAFWAGLGTVLVPVVWIESVEAKDYLLATGAAVFAIDRMMAGRPVLSGVLLGVAAGFRMPMLIFAPAVALAHPRAPGAASFRPILTCGLASLATSILALSPAWLTRGLGIFESNASTRPVLGRLLRTTFAGFGTLGLLGAAVGLLGVCWGVSRRRPHPRLLRACLAVLAVQVALLAFDSSASSYLVPAMPFLVALIAAYAPRPAAAPALAAFCLSGLVLSPSQGAALRRPPIPRVARFHWRFPPHAVHPVFPAILQDHVLRRRREAKLEALAAKVRALEPGDAVVAGVLMPRLLLELGVPRLGWEATCCGGVDIRYVMTASAAAGRRVYALPHALRWSEQVTGDQIDHAEPLAR